MNKPMTRAVLASSVFALIKQIMPDRNSLQLWITIAKTDDETLQKDYEFLITKNYSLRDWEIRKDEQREQEKKRK